MRGACNCCTGETCRPSHRRLCIRNIGRPLLRVSRMRPLTPYKEEPYRLPLLSDRFRPLLRQSMRRYRPL
ncbi:hypothetical protein CHCC14566_0435 [Bacillus licheniformis]|nr:hypothetical protein CHCC14566_0435 [Bacillus licheniformis]